MAKSRFHTPVWAPGWMAQMPPIQNQAIAFSTLGTLDAASERVICYGHVYWADGGTHDLRSVRWRSGGAGLTGTLTVSARDMDLANGPPGRDDGSADQSIGHTNPAGSTNFTSTFSADRASVAHGTLLAIVWEITAFTSGNLNIIGAALRSGSQTGYPGVTSFLGSTYASVDAAPACTLVAADGTLGVIFGGLPQPTSTAVTTAFNSGSTPDEYALAYTPTEPHWCGGAQIVVSVASGADFDIVLYEGTTAQETVSIDANTLDVAGIVELTVLWPDVAMTVGNTYYLAVKPTTANSVTVYTQTITSGDADLIGDGMSLATRVDAGSWSAVATQFPLRWSFGMVASDDGAGGGGGGLLTHPGMAGGMRG